jgi:hypothetical protein
MSKIKDRGWIATSRLLHYGVKGMHWGVRRSNGSASPVTVKQKGKRLTAKGGEGHPATAEAVRAKSLGQRARKSGLHSLTNEELRAYNDRLNLETNAKRLTEGDQSLGSQYVSKFLKKSGDQAVNQVANEAASRAVKGLFTQAAKKGAKAAIGFR